MTALPTSKTDSVLWSDRGYIWIVLALVAAGNLVNSRYLTARQQLATADELLDLETELLWGGVSQLPFFLAGSCNL